jgi:iron complex outermembrane recepter protein
VNSLKNGTAFQETVFYNVAKATSKGVELELQARLAPAFLVRVAASYLDAKYDQFHILQPGLVDPATDAQIPPLDLNLFGLPVPRSPKRSANLMDTCTFEFASAGKLELSSEMYYEDKNLFSISAAPPPAGFSNVTSPYKAYLDWKTLLNGSLGWTSANGQYFARLYGKNLSGERHRIASQSVATLWTHTQWGEPLNYGLEVGAKFGGTE